MTQPERARGTSAVMALAAITSAYLVAIGLITVGAVALRGDGGGGAGSQETTINVTLSEFKISGNLVAPPGRVKLAIKNEGSVDHDVTVKGSGVTTGTVAAGKSTTLDLGRLEEGEVTLYCSVPGHEESGMKATLKITASAAGGSGDGGGGGESAHHGGEAPDYKQMDVDMLASFAAYPAETKGVGNQPLEPTILPDGTKQFELTAKIADWEVEPGRVVKAWTYNGTVPGPMLRADVGDKIRVVFRNELPLNQDIHWHGIETPFSMDGVAPITQEPVEPGGEFIYEFTVNRPYMAMYHPHLHGQMTVPNGMWGVFQVGPTPIARGITVDGITIPADVKPALEMPMVLNDSGAIGYSLNGKGFPATAPIVVKEGDWVALTYYNEGLQVHPMHLHRFPQLVVARDGFKLPQPFWVDTLLVAPGERYTVMFQATEKGTWAFHCHVLTHAERETGMFGMVTALIVE